MRPELLVTTITMVILGVSGGTSAKAAGQSAAIERLAVLIGSWDTEDVYTAVDGSQSRETGVRTCSWTMRNSYVECVTVGRNQAGREREYRWFITHNPVSSRYEVVGIFSNVPMKVRQTIHIDSTGSVWNIRSASSVSDGIEWSHAAQLIFDGRDRAVWTGYRSPDTGPPSAWSVSTRETWARRVGPPR